MNNTESAQVLPASGNDIVSQLQATAKHLLSGGVLTVPVALGKKSPHIKGWQNLRITEAEVERYFSVPGNIGILLGEPSGGIVDVDLDCEEAVAAAPLVLPPTGMIHGRPSRPSSHWWFRVTDSCPATQRFSTRKDGTLCELRSTGAQTVIPPSIHPTAEQLRWEKIESPARVLAADIRDRVTLLGCVSLIARHWPSQGARNEAALALAGALLRSGRAVEQVEALLRAVVVAARDEEIESRARLVFASKSKLDAGEPITGWPRLVELVGSDIVDPVRRWLGVESPPVPVAISDSPRPSRRRHNASEPGSVLVSSLAHVSDSKIEWTWRGYLLRGKVTLIDGDPGNGKSTATIDLAARITTGTAMPFSSDSREPGQVLLISGEDGVADTIRPRLEAASANLDRAHFLREVRQPDGKARMFELPTDLEELERVIVEKQIKLVVIDPLSSFLSPAIDAHRDQDVRSALSPLAATAEKTGAAVIIVRHLNKGVGKSAMYRGGGSIGIIGAARTAFVIAPALDDPTTRVFAQIKNNLGPLAPALRFRISSASNGSSFVEWLGIVETSADELVGDGGDATALEEATEWLRERLSLAEFPQVQLVAEAQKHGISTSTLRRAKKRIGAKSKKADFYSPWVWHLPGVTPPPFQFQ